MTEEEKLARKTAKKEAKAKAKAEGKTLFQEFKKFITRGNVLDMSVGVIMGGAFNAIVTALTNILLSVATWAVPGGLKGLVTVLPALNNAQAGMNPAIGLTQSFKASDLHSLAKELATLNYGSDVADTVIEQTKSTILSKYTLHGTIYTYNMSAVIDWGSFINACIIFLIIALTLFIIIRTFTMLKNKRQAFEESLKASLKKEQVVEEKAE